MNNLKHIQAVNVFVARIASASLAFHWEIGNFRHSLPILNTMGQFFCLGVVISKKLILSKSNFNIFHRILFVVNMISKFLIGFNI